MRPVTFKWNAKNAVADDLPQYDEGSSDPVYGEGKAHHGFIAQEVEDVIANHPEIVEGNSITDIDAQGVHSLADGALMPMMVRAVQELSSQVDELKAEIQTLKGE